MGHQCGLQEAARRTRVVASGGQLGEHLAPLEVQFLLVVADPREQIALEEVDRGEPGAAVVHRLEDLEAAVPARRLDADQEDPVQDPVDEAGNVLGLNPRFEQLTQLLAAGAQIA
ncbi:hypothetical protein GCM10027614_70750 [Micromonospora vulcania]